MSEQPVIRQRRRMIDVTPTPEEVEAAHERFPGLQASEGFVMVRRIAYGQEEETTERVRVPTFHGLQTARVSVSAGCTRNLGDYNSAKVEVFVSMPCLPEESEIDRCYNFVTGLLDRLVPQELAKAGVPMEGVTG